MENYEILTVIYHEKFNYVIADDRGLNRSCLRPQEFREFINAHGCDVVELKIISCYLLMEIFSNEAVADHVKMAKFPNLRKLELNGMSFTPEWLNMLSNCCGQLETLNFENCSNGQGAPVQLAVDIKLEILQKFPHLKEITLHNYDFYSLTIEYPKWQELLGNLPLQALHLNDRIIGKSSTDNELRGQNTTAQLAELSLKTSLAQEKWLGNFPKFLRNFEKLTTLRIEVLETITQKMLQTLAEKCKDLQILQITNSTFDPTLSVVSWPENLKELALFHCRGLNFGNLQEILQNHPKLTKFISKSTEYQYEKVENFQISPGLQSLEMDCKYLWQLQELSNMLHNNHIKELIWHHEKQNCQLSEKPIPAAETYVDLPKLQKLIIPHHKASFGHITELLQHSSLEDLTVMHCGEYSGVTCEEVPSVEAAAAFQSNITQLSIPLDIFNEHLDFWLDFFAKNSKMATLSCTFTFEDFEYSQFLKRLIENPNFPEDLKKLDIFGYTIDCNDLRNHFNALINKLENENCEDLYRIVLSKEKQIK
uniref:Leucine Rich repeat protein n=1 Tax=Musca domestica TaxID=7370 RepID=A0A1I8NJQ4_MUSDO